ncbi:hypothetical protein [Shinella sumterensis]|uniref:Uncharacterized protein n=1 Tax=Shinella sumterensis TaxID=1967501 RepID=A0AA50H7F6_9HYPH|nr:hypothetical protein [Shinella sumterensis]WLS00995.1 hypothetical protein Q9313_26735 [Shinella sumterensis]WLS11775.1 hypothetical protein Q9314_27470 [Shinella sumterensis]
MALAMAAPAWASDGAAQPPAGVDPEVIACQKVTAAEMEQFIGSPATIRTNGIGYDATVEIARRAAARM